MLGKEIKTSEGVGVGGLKIGVVTEQNRNWQPAKRFKAVSSESGRLGLLNLDPRGTDPEAIVENKELLRICSPKGLCACCGERSLHNQIRLRSQSEAALH